MKDHVKCNKCQISGRIDHPYEWVEVHNDKYHDGDDIAEVGEFLVADAVSAIIYDLRR